MDNSHANAKHQTINPRTAVIIPAAGRGRRMQSTGNKAFLPLGRHSMLWWTLQGFLRRQDIHQIVVVHGSGECSQMRDEIPEDPRLSWVEGGQERQLSVHNACNHLMVSPPDWVLVHDAARPCVSQSLIKGILNALQDHAAVIPALPVVDALRRQQGDTLVMESREGLLAVQTPQGFHWKLFVQAYQHAKEHSILGLDDAQLVERLHQKVQVIAGERTNIKLTHPTDVVLAKHLLCI